MNQAFYIQCIQRYENSKSCNAGNTAGKLLANMIAHVLAFEPRLDITRGIVGSAFISRTDQPQPLPAICNGRPIRRRRLGRCCRPSAPQRCRCGVCFIGDDRLMPFALDQRLDDAMRQQIREPTNRRCEMGIGFISQSKVTRIVGGIHRLLH